MKREDVVHQTDDIRIITGNGVFVNASMFIYDPESKPKHKVATLHLILPDRWIFTSCIRPYRDSKGKQITPKKRTHHITPMKYSWVRLALRDAINKRLPPIKLSKLR
jgi:hypothetical protein